MSNILLLNAYGQLLSTRTHSLPVVLLCAMLGWSESNNMDNLKGALRSLATTPIEFNMMEDGKESWQIMTMLSFGGIKDGICTYRYDEYLAERLYDPEIYATINIRMQRLFKGGYSLNLYENCLRYKNTGSTGWIDLHVFRKIIGATAAAYDEFKYLNREVITKAVVEINKVSDILIEPEYEKSGRKISKIKFTIKQSPQQNLFKNDVLDEFADIRKNSNYLKLREHGIQDRLALKWVIDDEERVRLVIEYVEGRDKQNLIKQSTGGYISKLLKDGVVISPSIYEVQKQEDVDAKKKEQEISKRSERMIELENQYKLFKSNSIIKAMPVGVKCDYASQYGRDVEPLKSLQSATGLCRDSVEQAKFMIWIRSKIAPVEIDVNEFDAWLHAKKPAK